MRRYADTDTIDANEAYASGYDDGYEAGVDEARQDTMDELFNLGSAEAAWHEITDLGRQWIHSDPKLVAHEWAAAKRDGLIK